MHSTDDKDLRRFSRVPFHVEAQLQILGRTVKVNLLDIALKGALIETRVPEPLVLHEKCRLILTLTDNGEAITMDGNIAHLEDRHVGIQCIEIDIANMTHLRRLLELNTGDADLVDRELAQLIRHRHT